MSGGKRPAAPPRVFVLRVWFEEDGASSAQFRAALHEGAAARQYFASPDDCLEHLYRQFVLPGAGTDADRQTPP